MFSKTMIAAFVAAPAAVSAVGNAIVQNKCSAPAYFWSVDVDDPGSMKTIAPGGSYSEPYKSPSTGGVSIKLSPKPIANAYDGEGIAQFEYTLDGMIWYDISLINGNPFKDGGMKLIPGESSCPTKICPADQTSCSDAYMVWNDDHATGACSSASDTTFVLCSGDPHDGSSAAPAVAAPAVAAKVDAPVEAKEPPAPAAPASAPVFTAAPAPVVPAPAPDAGVFTTFVTQVVTVAARDAAPEPTGLPLKRDDSHANMHKRAAHRHHFHRHGDVN